MKNMNDDLISRKEAITAIQKAYADTVGGTDRCAVWKNVGLTNALHIMQDLPSAQPEIIRCKDCKYFDPLTEDFDYNFCDAWAGGTNEDMFCGFAERRQDADSSGNMSGTQKALKCTETHSCDYQRTETHGWIPVTERLPDKKTEVIYSLDNHFVSTGYMTDRDYNGDEMELHWEDMESGALIYPEAWMPLPEPYKEGQE